nr:MAG TPA: hypothetical protein [Caudoviricetes sp.]
MWVPAGCGERRGGVVLCNLVQFGAVSWTNHAIWCLLMQCRG